MAISVGPTLFAVLKYSLNHSYKAGLAFILGVSVSDIMYVVVANVAAVWLEMLGEHRRQIAFGGAIVLIIVGLLGVLGKYKPQRPSATKVSISGAHLFRIWSSGFLINTINPGVILSWLAAVTATANTTNLYRIIVFGCALGLILVVDVCKVFAADAIRRRLTLRRIMYLQKTSAFCILFVGVGLFISTVFNLHLPKKGEQSVYHHFQSRKAGNFVKA